MTIDASFIAEVNKKIDAVEPGWTRNFRFNVTSIDGRSDGFNIPPLRKYLGRSWTPPRSPRRRRRTC